MRQLKPSNGTCLRSTTESKVTSRWFKDYHFDDFKEAINSVYSNGYHINQDVTQMLMKGISGPPASAEEPLTNTEIRILELICEQLTNEEIADKLNLSRHTIHTYRNRILTKTGSSNTAGLVVYAIKNGMYHLQS